MNEEEQMPTYGDLYAENFRLEHNNRVLQQRIDKAIEYVKTKKCKYDGWDITVQLYEDEIKQLLDILEGKSE